ncbi:hypothetical protein GWK91_12920 [Virgibacillus sp. MSP4-1]|uniref:hypothetical protein n=1 Tax=Virgibacillus sp. MSP4-1 TaxID=2700081 RepID=UPI0003A765DE|nr:hypothetical protein [Virgibacillus sp. MSP4-1]QHS23792.1 hypothetical protein GWK91_12920 [Virgibacillus sp. MSP4-1]
MGVHQENIKAAHKARSPLKSEMIEYTQLLEEMKIKISDLPRLSPQNADTRQKAIKVAKMISDNRNLSTLVNEKKKLTRKEMKQFPIEHHKLLKKYKTYIMAWWIIYAKDLIHIKNYIKF